MKRDSLLVSLLMMVVLAAGAVFFLFGGDGEDTEFTPADDQAVEEQEDKPRGPSRDIGETLIPTPTEVNELPESVAKIDVNLGEDEAAGIKGRVRGADEKFVEGALVALCLDYGDAQAVSVQGKIQATVATDAEGRFVFENVDVFERYVLRVEDEAHCSQLIPCLQLEAGESRRVDVQLHKGLALTGLVLDREGKPVQGVEVRSYDQATRAMDPTADIERSALTDDNGKFQFQNLKPGMKRIVAFKTGYAQAFKHPVQLFDEEDAKPINLVMDKGAFIAGKVIDADDELPISEVMVTVRRIRNGRDRSGFESYPPIVTDDEGNFTFDGLRPGAYKVGFLAPQGKGYARIAEQRTASTGRDTDMVVKLKGMPSITGRVIDEATGEPITKFALNFARGKQNIMPSRRLTQRFESEEGEFQYMGLEASGKGDFYLFARAKGYAGGRSPALKFGSGDVTGLVIEMYRGATVTGQITDSSGVGVSNATVTLEPQLSGGSEAGASFVTSLIQGRMRTSAKKGRTDKDGKFKIEGVPENFYKLMAKHSRYSNTESEIKLEVMRSGEFEFPALTMMKGAIVTGRVVDDKGMAAPRSTIQLTPKGGGLGGGSYFAKTGSSGRFQVNNVKPGIYTARVTEVGGKPKGLGDFLGAMKSPPVPFMVGDGEEHDLGDLK